MGVSNNFARSELQRQSKVTDTGRHVALDNYHLRSLDSIPGIKQNYRAKHFFLQNVSPWWGRSSTWSLCEQLMASPLGLCSLQVRLIDNFLEDKIIRCCSSVKKSKTNREGAPILWPSWDISWSGPELNDYRNISSLFLLIGDVMFRNLDRFTSHKTII